MASDNHIDRNRWLKGGPYAHSSVINHSKSFVILIYSMGAAGRAGNVTTMSIHMGKFEILYISHTKHINNIACRSGTIAQPLQSCDTGHTNFNFTPMNFSVNQIEAIVIVDVLTLLMMYSWISTYLKSLSTDLKSPALPSTKKHVIKSHS